MASAHDGTVLRDIGALQEWIALAGSPWNASRWVARLLIALRRLERAPRAHALALEAASFPECELRPLVFGRIRVLFVVVGNEVLVLHARHGNRALAGREDLLPDLDDGNGSDVVREAAACVG